MRYGPVSDSNSRINAMADGPARTFTITGLTLFINYSIEVAGNSGVGHGPFSNPITEVTYSELLMFVIMFTAKSDSLVLHRHGYCIITMHQICDSTNTTCLLIFYLLQLHPQMWRWWEM